MLWNLVLKCLAAVYMSSLSVLKQTLACFCSRKHPKCPRMLFAHLPTCTVCQMFTLKLFLSGFFLFFLSCETCSVSDQIRPMLTYSVSSQKMKTTKPCVEKGSV